ncbi:MAG: DUF4838 domain-containing protein [Lentisphaeria bacterium]|nr:DUF4838 domain-containing protein [Lentisphaeria bacterium]
MLIKRKIFLPLFLPLLLLADHPAASGGKARMAIVYRPVKDVKAGLYDHVFKRYNTPDLAASELAGHLRKMTGADFKILKESEWDGRTPAFLIGQTDFARRSGIDFSKFGKEEWLYRSIGKNLVIGGGFNWGDELAVYKFLEEELGCHWLSYDSTFIPKVPELTVREVNRRGKPSFSSREIYIPPWGQKSDRIRNAMYVWMRRNRSNFQREVDRYSHQYIPQHSFYSFVDPDVYFKEHPEYFSMNEQGKRFCGSRKTRSGGQLCLSNPKVREITEAQLRKFIAADRASRPKSKWPVRYAITQCDATNYICRCPECKKITEREGSESGLLFHFLNPIAESIAKDYPEIKISTFIYVSTDKAPKYIKPAGNISLQWCDLYSYSDCYRPLVHPINRKQREIFESWRNRGIRIESIWDYWNMGGRWINPPRIETMADAIGPDLRYLYKHGVKYYFTEAEHAYYNVDTNFIDLQFYLGLQLTDDITKDENRLISRFMKLQYGPAEKPMTAALNLIRKAVAEEKNPIFYTGNCFQTFLTADFTGSVWKHLKEAQAVTEPGSAFRLRVEQEMLPVLRAMVFYSHLRQGQSKAELLKEYSQMRLRQLQERYTESELPSVRKILKAELDRLEFDFPTPEKFKSLPADSIRKYSAMDFQAGKKVKDPDSALKTVIRIGSPNLQKDALRHADPNDKNKYIIGIHNFGNKKGVWFNLKPRLSRDGKYHWYCIRNFQFGPKNIFFAWSWWTKCDISNVYVDGGDNRWDVWFSLKAVGPAYVKDGQGENQFLIESVILTKPGAIQ